MLPVYKYKIQNQHKMKKQKNDIHICFWKKRPKNQIFNSSWPYRNSEFHPNQYKIALHPPSIIGKLRGEGRGGLISHLPHIFTPHLPSPTAPHLPTFYPHLPTTLSLPSVDMLLVQISTLISTKLLYVLHALATAKLICSVVSCRCLLALKSPFVAFQCYLQFAL